MVWSLSQNPAINEDSTSLESEYYGVQVLVWSLSQNPAINEDYTSLESTVPWSPGFGAELESQSHKK